MKIFQMKTKPHNIPRFDDFRSENFLCIGWPGIGDLTGVDKDEIRDRLAAVTGKTGRELGNALGKVNAFVNTMHEGDVVVVAEQDWAYFCRVGAYQYEPAYDNEQDAMCHRRPVTWLGEAQVATLNGSLQRLIRNRNTICRFPDPVEQAGLDQILGQTNTLSAENAARLDTLLSEALTVLEQELHAPDAERRLKAAAELIAMKRD